MIQSDWAKVGVKAKIVSYEWGEYLSGMRKGEHDTALFGWMSDNGDPDNFADVLLGCDSIKPDLTPRAGAIKSIIRWLKRRNW